MVFFGSSIAATFLLASTPSCLRVCLSPGCVADGAEGTLDRLSAIAPPSISVEEGGCVSKCGAGPVVEEQRQGVGGSTVVHRHVEGDALLSLLRDLAESDGFGVDDGLVEGYDFARQAEAHADEGSFEEAVDLYEQAVMVARSPVMEWSKHQSDLRAQGGDDDGETNNASGGRLKSSGAMEWYIRVLRRKSSAHLAIGDVDGARAAAFACVQLSENSDPLCYETLAEVCEASGDEVGELMAIRQVLELEPANTDGLPRDVALRRREMGFRASKLERELSK